MQVQISEIKIPFTTSEARVGTYIPAYDSPAIKNGLERNSGYNSNHFLHK